MTPLILSRGNVLSTDLPNKVIELLEIRAVRATPKYRERVDYDELPAGTLVGIAGVELLTRMGLEPMAPQWLSPEDLAMLFDESDHLRNGRSSSAWAK